jgi:uncharacterized protein YccT (UPF0319 family)
MVITKVQGFFAIHVKVHRDELKNKQVTNCGNLQNKVADYLPSHAENAATQKAVILRLIASLQRGSLLSPSRQRRSSA